MFYTKPTKATPAALVTRKRIAKSYYVARGRTTWLEVVLRGSRSYYVARGRTTWLEVVLRTHQIITGPLIRPKPSSVPAPSVSRTIGSVPQTFSAAAMLTNAAVRAVAAHTNKAVITLRPPVPPAKTTMIAPNVTSAKVLPASTSGKTTTTSAAMNDSRVYIHVPARKNVQNNEKALLSVNLSTIATQYVAAQKVRCDQIFLENLVREHNNFSIALKQAKDILLAAHDCYKSTLAGAKDYQTKTAARDMYKVTCDKLGESMRSSISQNINNLIRLVSTSDSKTSTNKNSSVAGETSAAKDAPIPIPTQPISQTAIPKASSIPGPKAIPTLKPQAPLATMPMLKLSKIPLNGSSQSSSSARLEHREFIDIDELKKTEQPQHVINLCSDDDEDPTPSPPASKDEATIDSLGGKSSAAPVAYSETFDVGRQPFSPDGQSSNTNNNGAEVAETVTNRLDFSTATVTEVPVVTSDNELLTAAQENDNKESRADSPLIGKPEEQLELSSEDDLVGVTPRILRPRGTNTVSKDNLPPRSGKGEEKGSSSTGEEKGFSSTGEEKGSSSTGEKKGSSSTGEEKGSISTGEEKSSSSTGEEKSSSVIRKSTRISVPSGKAIEKSKKHSGDDTQSDPISTLNELDHSEEPAKSDELPQAEVHTVEEDPATAGDAKSHKITVTGCEAKAGPSGITRRALRRLIKEQEKEESEKSKKPSHQSPERIKKSNLSKEFVSSSDEDSSSDKADASPPSASGELQPTPVSDGSEDNLDISTAVRDSGEVTTISSKPAALSDEEDKRGTSGVSSPTSQQETTGLVPNDSTSDNEIDESHLAEGCRKGKRHHSDSCDSNSESPNRQTRCSAAKLAKEDGMSEKTFTEPGRARRRAESGASCHTNSKSSKKPSEGNSKDSTPVKEKTVDRTASEGVSDLEEDNTDSEQLKGNSISSEVVSEDDKKVMSEGDNSSDEDLLFASQVFSRTKKSSDVVKENKLSSNETENSQRSRRRTKRGSPKKRASAGNKLVASPKNNSCSAEDSDSTGREVTDDAVAEKSREDVLLGESLSGDDDLLDVSLSAAVEVNDALLADSDSAIEAEITPSADPGTAVAKASDSSDATLTDTVQNTKAMHELRDALLSSSDTSSDPPPRVILRRRAKRIHAKNKSVKAKSLSTAEQRAKTFNRLKPEQRRFMRKRADGLRISLMEQRQSALQKLLLEIESKSVQEMDTDDKLSLKSQVVLTRMDLTDEQVVKKLVDDNQSSNKFRWKDAPLEPDSAADSDLEKEIERLAKFTVLLNSAGTKSKKLRSSQRKNRVKKHQKKKVGVMESDASLSDLDAAQSDEEPDVDTSGSDSDSQRSDIIIIPNKDQLANEEAMKSLLQMMADSESEANSLSSVDSSDSDTEKEAKKIAATKKSKRKGRKLHPLEQEGLGEKSGSRREFGSSVSSASSSSESYDDDLDSSDSEIILRGKKRKFHLSGSETDNTIDKKLSSRDSRRTKKGRRKRVVRMNSSSSDEQDDTGSSSDSDIMETTPVKGRHKIRKVLDDKELKATTKSAHKLEMERRKRIEEMQKKYNEELLAKEGPQALKSHRELVLERSEKGKPVVDVDPNLVKKLKPHQIDAVRFMWECVCETVERSNKGPGGGCILAHCMGLGKTLSLITFLHTLLTHEDKLNLRRMLVIAPLNTVLNWKDEVEKWTSNLEIDVDVDELQSCKKNIDRMHRLKRWHSTGGIMVVGYDLFRNLSLGTSVKKQELKDRFQQYLIKPGADVIVCDEGHLLKNAKSGMRKSVMTTASKRRIVLTGTPLQNNLKEYHCMVDFVKPSLLGTASEFNNRFVHPITNGQYEDSTPFDVKLMKKRAHVLHEMLAGCVQRRDYSELTKFLPPKHEYILSIKLTELQIKLYQFYIDKIKADGKLGIKGKLFSDFQNLSRVWSHPMALELHKQRREQEADFIDDESSETSPESSDDGSDILVKGSDNENDTWRPNKKKKTAVGELKAEAGPVRSGASTPVNDHLWWKDEVKDVKLNDISLGYKFVLLLEILKKCEEIGDKVLLFSQGILTLDLIEDFLEMIHNSDDEVTKALYGSVQWKKGLNYFRIDGTVDAAQRRRACSLFNKPANHNARLFLISTRAGGMGINLVGANRVIIFDASWNPSFDVQAIFRAYRFGQTKPVYVYRFLAQATMEERIYERQIAKLSLSERVVDEKQIHRHFTANDLTELYNFKPATDEPNEIHAFPKDLLMADLLETHGHLIRRVREHDSLLENKEEEKLSEEERKAAWQEYQQEKERVNLPPPPSNIPLAAPGYQGPMYHSSSVVNQILLNDIEVQRLKETLQRRFPSTTGEHLKKMLEVQCHEINAKRLKAHQSHTAQMRAAGPANQERGLYGQSHMNEEQMQQRRLIQQQQHYLMQHFRQQQLQQQISHGQRDLAAFPGKK
ncbi:transcriptional regulator ATRX-like [Watersipora subatra]|uniref:transcriptional regulator ATRX-like n=1 Tax=Watersipora subatra TaxID=2589382 RepID=UPI00355C1391